MKSKQCGNSRLRFTRKTLYDHPIQIKTQWINVLAQSTLRLCEHLFIDDLFLRLLSITLLELLPDLVAFRERRDVEYAAFFERISPPSTLGYPTGIGDGSLRVEVQEVVTSVAVDGTNPCVESVQ